MATDQGKASNLNGLALMGALTDRVIPKVGTPTCRPPFTPVAFSALAGNRTGRLMSAVRRLALGADQRELDGRFGEWGGWLRPPSLW